ncbi:MAG: hydrogenase maturation protease [Elainella sp. Prado103]|jgi:hydrogenase maturation protease|nr:hydrogenase maturation protease [Elainella sp. Prado103]
MDQGIGCLVIGYGNTLRSDDAAGQQIADRVAAWNLERVHSLAVHQLTPELAEPLAMAQMAIFIDVYAVQEKTASEKTASVQVIELSPTLESNYTTRIGHSADPRSLLMLAQQVYGTCPPSWWVLVPAINFEFGEALSSLTQQGVVVALEQVRQLIQDQLSITENVADSV